MVCDACDLQAAAGATGRFDRIFVQRFQTLHEDAVESTVPRRNGLQIANAAHTMQTLFLVFAWCARARNFACRCGGVWLLFGWLLGRLWGGCCGDCWA
eukprot:5688672-Lingulodinium_polyedra.AAC.1